MVGASASRNLKIFEWEHNHRRSRAAGVTSANLGKEILKEGEMGNWNDFGIPCGRWNVDSAPHLEQGNN